MSNKAQIFQTLLTGLRFSGVSLNSGLVYFYEPGTETERSIYTDRNKSTLAANPYTLDPDGRAEIYGDGVYDVVVKNSLGATKAEWPSVALQDVFTGSEQSSTYYASLNAAITAIGSTPTTLNISTADFPMTGNATVQATLTLKMTYPGSIDQGAFTLTINSPFEAGRYQVFAGTGTVNFGTLQTGIRSIYPEWYSSGAPNDATDNTSAFQAIADSLGATGNAVIDLNEGVYRIGNLDLTGCQGGIWFKGKGWTSTYVRLIEATGNVFDLTNARFTKWTDIGFTALSTAQRTSGSLFRLDTTGDHVFQRLRFASPYEAFYLYKSSNNLIEDCIGTDFAAHAWNYFAVVEGSSATNRFIRSGLSTANVTTGAGWLIKQAADTTGPDTVILDQCFIQKSGSGLVPYGVKGEYGEFVEITNSHFEPGSANGVGVSFEGLNNSKIVNSHITTSQEGISISGGTNLQVLGNRLYKNSREGIKYTGGTHINISANSLFDNSAGGDNTYDAINIAANLSEFSINNNVIGKILGDGINHRYGIYLATGKSTTYTIVNNPVTDFGTGAVYDGGVIGNAAGYDKAVKDNPGASEIAVIINSAVRTTDATETTLWSKALADKTMYLITAKVVNQGAASGGRHAYIRHAVVYRSGAGAVLQGSVVDGLTIESEAAHDCTIDVSGNDARVRVTGAGGDTRDWYASVEVVSVMDATAYGALP